MRTRRSWQLAEQLDAAIDGRDVDLPGDLAPLVALAERVREAARRIEPDPSLARRRVQAAYRPAGPSRRPARLGAKRPGQGQGR